MPGWRFFSTAWSLQPKAIEEFGDLGNTSSYQMQMKFAERFSNLQSVKVSHMTRIACSNPVHNLVQSVYCLLKTYNAYILQILQDLRRGLESQCASFLDTSDENETHTHTHTFNMLHRGQEIIYCIHCNKSNKVMRVLPCENLVKISVLDWNSHLRWSFHQNFHLRIPES